MNNDDNNVNQNPNNPNEPKDAGKEFKYTQEDVDKLAANKAKEAKRNQEKELEGKKVLTEDELKKLIEDAQKKGAEYAQMTAEEKAKAEQAEREKQQQVERDASAKEIAEMKQRMALYETKDALTNAGLPAEFATFLNNTDSDKRDQLIGSFKDLFDKTVETRVTEKLKGSSNPQTGGNASQQSKISKTQPPVFDATKMSVTEFMNAGNDNE